MSSGAQQYVRYIAEATYAQTPANPAWLAFRKASCTLGRTAEGLESSEARGDRRRSVYRMGANKVGGELGFDLAYGDFDAWLAAALMGSWTPDTPAAGTDRLVDGVTRQSFSVEVYQSDQLAAAEPYHRFVGVEVNTLDLKIPAKGLATATLGLIGQEVTYNQAVVANSTYGNLGTNPVLDSFTGVLTEGGVTNAFVTEVSLKVDNKLESLYAWGSKLPCMRPSIEDVCKISGSIGVHFLNSTFLKKFRDETESSLEFTLPDALGNELLVRVPRIVYTGGGSAEAKGPGNMVLSMPFEALLDPVTGYTLALERTDT